MHPSLSPHLLTQPPLSAFTGLFPAAGLQGCYEELPCPLNGRDVELLVGRMNSGHLRADGNGIQSGHLGCQQAALQPAVGHADCGIFSVSIFEDALQKITEVRFSTILPDGSQIQYDTPRRDIVPRS